MLSQKMRRLETAKARLAQLEHEVESELNAELAGLPRQYGFSSASAFLRAFRSATGRRHGGRRGTAKAVSTGKRPRKRGVITDAKRAQVKAMVEAGRTGPAIAKALKISGQSVHNIKKTLGLVKPRK